MTLPEDPHRSHLEAPRALELPAPPQPVAAGVQAWEESVNVFTFLPAPPDPNPMFLQNRVYQGSRGEVYPLPFVDRVYNTDSGRRWRAIHLENRYLRLMILPEIGAAFISGSIRRTATIFSTGKT